MDWQYGVPVPTEANQSIYTDSKGFRDQITKTLNKPFNFKIGHQNQSSRLDDIDQRNSQIQYKTMNSTNSSRFRDPFEEKKLNMVHGAPNNYYPTVKDVFECQALWNEGSVYTSQQSSRKDSEQNSVISQTNGFQLRRHGASQEPRPRSLFGSHRNSEN